MKKICIYLFINCSYLGTFCTDQVDIIKKYLDRYQRPITFLGIVNNNDELVSSLAQQYDGVFVLLSPRISKSFKIPSNLIHLSSKPNTKRLKHLGECEHFDVVFVNHHTPALRTYQSQWDYVESLHNLGEHVIVIVQPENNDLVRVLGHYNFKRISTIGKGQVFYKYHRITFNRRVQWLEPASDTNYVRHIESTYTEKRQDKTYGPRPSSNEWLPGINLVTFKMLNGKIPSYQRLAEEIKRVFTIRHFDWMPNNMIVQGNNLELIDFEQPASEPKTVQTQHMLDLTLHLVTEPNPKRVVDIFEQILKYCREQLHPTPHRNLMKRSTLKY